MAWRGPGHAKRGPQRPRRVAQAPVASGFGAVSQHARQQRDPGLSALAPDVDAVAYVMKPTVARPGYAAFRTDLVAHDDVAAIANAPEPSDCPQAKIVFLPAEEQKRVVTSRVVPRLTPDRMAGTDERRRFKC